jgi:hypothetical protein
MLFLINTIKIKKEDSGMMNRYMVVGCMDIVIISWHLKPSKTTVYVQYFYM